jgi:hypothetical protein
VRFLWVHTAPVSIYLDAETCCGCGVFETPAPFCLTWWPTQSSDDSAQLSGNPPVPFRGLLRLISAAIELRSAAFGAPQCAVFRGDKLSTKGASEIRRVAQMNRRS